MPTYTRNDHRHIPPDGAMEDMEISSFLHRKIEESINHEDGTVSEYREKNLEYYRGDGYGNERDGYSQYVSREVLETVEWALPSILSVFFSNRKPVEFMPMGPEDVELAKQETDVVNHVMFEQNSSFQEFHDFFKSALIDPVAYFKVHCLHQEKVEEEEYTGLTEGQLANLANQDDVEIVEVVELPAEEMTPAGPSIIVYYDVRIRRTSMRPHYKLEGVPPEEMLVARDATTVDLDQVDFLCHRVRVPFADLVARGYDPDLINDNMSVEFNPEYEEERVNRHFHEDELPDQGIETDWSMRRVTVYECYARFDADGDGIAEFRKVVMIGSHIFENEITSYQPFVAVSSILMPFKHIGMSYVDTVKDLQLLSSMLTRQLLDNIYKTNVNKRFFNKAAIDHGSRTLDALENTQAETVFVKGPPQQAVMTETNRPIVEQIMATIQYVQDRRKVRSGVAPENHLNPDVLRDATAHGMMSAQSRSSQRLEHLVRVFAEVGVRKIALKVHQLLRMYQDRPLVVALRGRFLETNPAEWRDRANLRICVGLGFNTEQEKVSSLIQMLTLQKEALSQGLATPAQIHNTLEKLVNAAGIGFVSEFFVDPKQPGWQPPKPAPDPQMIIAQAQAQKVQLEAETERQRRGVDIQKVQAESEKIRAENSVNALRIKGDLEIRQQELNLRFEELERNTSLIVDQKLAEIEKLQAQIDLLNAQVQETTAKTDTLQEGSNE